MAAAADARQVFVNAVDDPANASAYLGGVVRRGGVTLAISTDGHAPALAGLLREGLDALLPARSRGLARRGARRRAMEGRRRADGGAAAAAAQTLNGSTPRAADGTKADTEVLA